MTKNMTNAVVLIFMVLLAVVQPSLGMPRWLNSIL